MRRRKRGRKRVRRLVKRLFFIIFYFGMPPFDRARFLCKRRARDAASTVEIKSAQFQVSRYARRVFSIPHPPPPPPSSYFPFHHRQPAFNALKMRFENFLPLFFSKKNSPGEDLDPIRNSEFRIETKGGKNIPSNDGMGRYEKKKKKFEFDEFQTRRYLLDRYCYENTGTFFFLSSFFLLGIRGARNDPRYTASRTLFATARRTFRGIGP